MCYMWYVVVKSQDLLKNKKRKELLSNLEIKTTLNKVPLLGEILS